MSNNVAARLSEMGLTPDAEGRCSGPGVVVVRINLSDCPLNKWLPLYRGGMHYGFSVIRQSASFSAVTISTRRPKTGDAEELVPVFLGLEYHTADKNPIGAELWWQKTGSNENVTVDIAVYLRPGSMRSYTPVLLMDSDGAAAQIVPFDTGGEDEAQNSLAVRAALTAIDAGEAAGDRNVPLDCDDMASTAMPDGTRGLFVHSKVHAEDTVGGEARQVQATPKSSVHGLALTAARGLHVNALVQGENTGDATMRTPECRTAGASEASTLYRLLVSAALRAVDATGTDWSIIHADVPSAIVNGRVPSAIRALWTNALDVKRDSDGTLLTPTEMNRYATGQVVNPGAGGTVIATLDARGLTNKQVLINVAGGATTVDIEVSGNGTTWIQIVNALATAAGVTVGLTALQAEIARAFRYIRVLTDAAAGASTIDAYISAQGA